MIIQNTIFKYKHSIFYSIQSSLLTIIRLSPAHKLVYQPHLRKILAHYNTFIHSPYTN